MSNKLDNPGNGLQLLVTS